MATLDATKVDVGLTGAISVAPSGTTLPTDATTALDAAFVDLGYLTQAGATEGNSVSLTDLVAWQNAAVIRQVQTAHALTLAFTLYQTDPDTLEFFYGNYSAGVVAVSGAQRGNECFSFRYNDGTKIVRIVFPNAQLSDKGDVPYTSGDGVQYPCTITAYPEAGGANKMYRYYSALS